ncbi:MAG: acetylxylan esterase [Thermoanaerobaculaceae bacterium]
MLGIDLLAPRQTLDHQSAGVLERQHFQIEKVVLETLPGLLATGTLYRPNDRSRPAPCVLYLCGHQIHPLGAKTQYQDRYLWYPAHGFACLVLDSLQCGEVQGIHHGTHTLGLMDWVSLGYTPAGVEVWNAMRAIDWLGTVPGIDATRVGVTGVSGGGVMTWFLAALDERVSVAAPSSSAYTIASQVGRNVVGRQCDCTFYPNVYRMDFPEIGALIAPRPLLILGGERDRIFPPQGYREVFRKVSRVYELPWFGESTATDRIRLAECNDGHSDSSESLREAREWMARWLAPDRPEALRASRDPSPPLEPPEKLVCLARIPPDAANFTIHRTFINASVPVLPKTAKEWQARRCVLIDWLQTVVFGWFSQEPIPFRTSRRLGSGGHARRFARFSEWEFDTERGVRIRAQLYEPRASGVEAPLLVVVKGRGEQVVFPDDELLPLFSDHSVLVVIPRFAEWYPSPVEYSSMERVSVICGRTNAAQQVWDVARAVRWVLHEGRLAPGKISVFGRGEAGIIGMYAALFEGRIAQVVLKAPPASHFDGPALPAILRRTDIAEVAAAIAPRELTLLSAPPPTFSLTRSIFQLSDCAPSFTQVGSLVAALRPQPAGSPRRELSLGG